MRKLGLEGHLVISLLSRMLDKTQYTRDVLAFRRHMGETGQRLPVLSLKLKYNKRYLNTIHCSGSLSNSTEARNVLIF